MTVQPTLYRSTDVGAPILTGSVGSLIALLDACLVNGYGSLRASATIHTSGTTVANNDTITIDGTTYTWKTALTPAANEVLIGGTAAINLSNLAAAIGQWGTVNTNYGTGTVALVNVQVTLLTATDLTISAMKGGAAGNSIAISKSAANITLSGATLAGGSGTDTTASAGWTKPFSGTAGGVYRPAAGNRFFFLVNDNAPGAGLGVEARVFASETCTAYSATAASSAALFPVIAAGISTVLRKSTRTDSTPGRVWFVWADDRTVYIGIQTGDVASSYFTYAFGDFFSYLTGDNFRTLNFGRVVENSNAAGTDHLDKPVASVITAAATGIYVARSYTGSGAALNAVNATDGVATNGGATMHGSMAFPNPADAGLYVFRQFILEPGTTVARRGYLRGLWGVSHALANFADGDTFTNGTKTFQIVKLTANGSMLALETSNTVDTST